MKNKSGFTLIEFALVVCFVSLVTVFFFIQKANLDAYNRDADRKTAINAMYYALEESFYKANNYYPEQISETNLTVISPELWTDPDGYNFGDSLSSYSYETANCFQGKCKEYTLKAVLEKEADYIKTNRN